MLITEKQAEKLYHAANALLLDIGMAGSASMDRESVENAMAVLFEIDGGVYQGGANAD